MKDKRSLLTTLANRGSLSMVGKGVIGFVCGFILIFVTISRNKERNNTSFYSGKTLWVENKIIDIATLPNPSARFEYLADRVNKNKNIDSAVSFIYNRCKGGSLLKELNTTEIDSILSRGKLSENLADTTSWVFYVNSIDSTDFLLVLKDSLIADFISMDTIK